MAKTDEMKFLDQHLKKVVFGLCALIMAYAVFQWVLSESQRPEIPKVNGRVVSAAELDAKLLAWAQRVDQRGSAGKKPLPPIYDYLGEIRRHRIPASAKAIANWGLPRDVMITPERIKTPEPPSVAKIKDVLLTFSPKLTEVKGACELIDKADNAGGIADQLVFRGIAEFKIGALNKAWNKAFRGSIMDEVSAMALVVEIERRAVLRDGTLGPVTRVVSTETSAVKQVEIPKYTGKNAADVRQAIDKFAMESLSRMLRPQYWNVWSQKNDKWTKPWIKAEEPKEEPAPAATPAAPASPAAAPAPVAAVASPADRTIKLWFHDTNVIDRQEYQYRVRLVFLNPLYTYDEIVYKGTPKDALIEKIPSAWGPWVQAEAIPRTTDYFVTSATAMGANQRLYCTVFTRSLGQVVSHKFKIATGHIIGEADKKPIVKEIKAAGVLANKEVDFSTSAIMIYADFDRKYVKQGRETPTKELISLEDGKLVSQMLIKDVPASDARAETFKRLKDMP